MVPLAASAIQSGLGGLISIFRFGHAKAVAKENSSIEAADGQVSKRMAELENLVNGGNISDADIDVKLQSILDEYYQIVAGSLQGRITSEDEFNQATKKTKSGAKCNAACVIGGRTNDLINAARPKLKALAAQTRGKTNGPAATKAGDPSFAASVAGGGGAAVGSKIGAALAPVLGSWVQNIPPWLLLALPGGTLVLLFLLFSKRPRRK